MLVHLKLDHSSRIRRGFKSEKIVCEILRSNGRECVLQPGGSSFDILADGWRIDLKTSAPTIDTRGNLRWLFNFHHSGKPITGCDFFILRAEGPIAGDEAIHLFLPAPSLVKTIALSTENLVRVYSARVQDFHLFLKGWFGKREDALPEACNAR